MIIDRRIVVNYSFNGEKIILSKIHRMNRDDLPIEIGQRDAECEMSTLIDVGLNDEYKQRITEHLRRIKTKENNYSSKLQKCSIFYYTIGIIALICNILSSSFSAQFLGECEKGYILFILSIVIGISTTMTTFLKIETKMTHFMTAKKGYHDIALQSIEFSSHDRTSKELSHFVKILLSQERKLDFKNPEGGCITF